MNDNYIIVKKMYCKKSGLFILFRGYKIFRNKELDIGDFCRLVNQDLLFHFRDHIHGYPLFLEKKKINTGINVIPRVDSNDLKSDG